MIFEIFLFVASSAGAQQQQAALQSAQQPPQQAGLSENAAQNTEGSQSAKSATAENPDGDGPSQDAEPLDDFEFDVDAPFDEMLDLGIDWPDENIDNFDSAVLEPANGAKGVNSETSAAIAPNDNQSDVEIAISEEKNTGEELALIDAPVAEGAREQARSDIARQDALRFTDEQEQVAQDDDRDRSSVRISTDGTKNYRILFTGLENIDAGRIIERFDALSALKTESNEAANGSQILRRARTDTQLMDQLLRLEGYYDNLVEYRIEDFDNSDNETDQMPVDVDVIIDAAPGVQYRFGNIALPGIEVSEDSEFLRSALPFTIGDPVQQDAILEGQLNLQNRLLDNGYPFGKVGEPDLLIDHERSEGDLTLPVTPDRKYQFGRIITSENSVLSAKHLQNIARFDEGDLFRQSNVVDLRQAIFATSLASNVVVTPTPSSTDDDQVDLIVALDPAPPRTIAGLVGFNTGEGFRIEASWEHRNFFPPEGGITVAGILGTREQAAGVTFRRNNFRGRDRVLTASFRARNQNLEAFDARSLDIGVGYERQTTLIFQKKWAYNIGLEYSLSDERAAFDNVVSRELFNILALPAGLSYDGSDDLLDATQGFRLSARVAPEISTGVDNVAYFKSQIDGSFYQRARDNLVIAGRVRLGSIAGAQTTSIAPSRRNFAGGGGSVRGFGFQDIGPEDLNGNPIGGRGLAEFAIEARYRIGSFGIVPFLDAGGVSNRSTPDFDDLRFAAGIGVRYYTSFGPVRIDIGTPFNRREGESVIAVAISLGQAF